MMSDPESKSTALPAKKTKKRYGDFEGEGEPFWKKVLLLLKISIPLPSPKTFVMGTMGLFENRAGTSGFAQEGA